MQVFDCGEGGYTAFHPLRRGLYNFSSLNKMVTSICPFRRGLHTFSSMNFSSNETRVIQLFIHQQEGDKVFVYLRRGFHTFHPSIFHPLRRGLHKFSSIDQRVTNLFIHLIFIHWEEYYTTFHPSTRRWQCRSWTFEQLATSVNQNMVIGHQKHLSWHSHASAISGKWWPLVGNLVHHCAELHQQYIQNVL